MTPTRWFYFFILIFAALAALPAILGAWCYFRSLDGHTALSDLRRESEKKLQANDREAAEMRELFRQQKLLEKSASQLRKEDDLTTAQLDQLKQLYIQAAELDNQISTKLDRSDVTRDDLSQMVDRAKTALAQQQTSDRWRDATKALLCGSVGILIGLLLYALWFYSRVIQLRHHLNPRGYDFLSIRQLAIIYASTFRQAWTLPDAASVLTIPTYSPTADSLVRYIRNHNAYKRRYSEEKEKK